MDPDDESMVIVAAHTMALHSTGALVPCAMVSTLAEPREGEPGGALRRWSRVARRQRHGVTWTDGSHETARGQRDGSE
eukprot:COSAG02_NODE_19435_length_882_cov_1.040868_1_plen_77_part_10